MRSDFIDYCRRCHLCQLNKHATVLPEGAISPLPIPKEPFTFLAIDFAGPFPADGKSNLIFVIMDCFSGYTYLVPVAKTIDAKQAALIMINRIFTVHGFPNSIVSDRDSKLTSRFWQQLMKNIQVDMNMATAYHHQTNGQVERRIRTIRQCLLNYINPQGNKWTQHLPHVQLAINAAPGDSTDKSPHQIIFGRDIKLLPSVTVRPTAIPSADDLASEIMKNQQLARKALEKARARQTSYSQRRRKEAETITPGITQVILKSLPYARQLKQSHKLIGPWLGPFDVSAGPDNNDNFRLELPPVMSRIHPWIHRSNLRVYLKSDNNMYSSQRIAPTPK